MAESTVSVITNVISLKLVCAGMRVKDKYDQLFGLQDSIAKIRKLLIDAEKQLVENNKVETWQKKLQQALEPNDLSNKDELLGLEAAISKIKDVLSDAENKQGKNKRVKFWLKKIEDVVYEADDLVDEVFNEVILKEASPVELNSNQLGKLKNIKEKLYAAADDHQEPHKVDANNGKERQDEEPDNKVSTKEFDPYFQILPSDTWMSIHVDAVKQLLFEDKNKQVEALAIVGYGGLGKTALAQQVFLDRSIERNFELRIWLNVPCDFFDRRLLIEGIIMYAEKMKYNRELFQSAANREVERIFKSLVEGIIVSTTKKRNEIRGVAEKDEKEIIQVAAIEKNDEGQSRVESVRMQLIREFLFEYGEWKGLETKIKTAFEEHLCHLDEAQFREEMYTRQKECFRRLNQNLDKDAVGISNELETKMSKLKDYLKGLDDDQLQEKLRNEILQEKKLLLVLDDVSNMYTETWDSFKKLLSKSKVREQSRILITTRNRNITSRMEHVYPLSNLNEEDSWRTFMEGIYSNLDESKYQIEEVEKKCRANIETEKMVKKCGGNPLALRTLGEKFCFKNLDSLTEFQKEVTEIVLPSLKPSYDILPHHLKHCFAYCSIFPHQYQIDVRNLIHLWMAQGLIYPKQGQRMEDMGYEYFQNLLQRSFFEQVEEDADSGIVTKCKMPNLIQDLAVFVGGARFVVLKEHDDEKHNIRGEAQHVSFHFHLHPSWKIPTLFLRPRRIQTIILPYQLHQESQGRVSHSTFENIISKCKALRTLDLHKTGIQKVPKSIEKLKYLRYLDLSQNAAIKSLPDSITNLSYLMILKLSKCYGLEELPRNMKRLDYLKHLEIDWCYNLTHMPLGLDQLTRLETLSQFVLKRNPANNHSAELVELKKLNSLRGELKVQNLRGDMSSEEAELERKQHLKSLTLAWKFDENTNINAAAGDLKTIEGLKPHPNLKELALFGYRSNMFPKWLVSHEKLAKFTLQKCKCKHLPPLSGLPSLKVLILDELANLKYISDKSEFHALQSTAFMPSLEELRLTELPKLKGWWADVLKTPTPLPSFPCLSKLIIEDCPKLHSMPLYPNLKEWLVLDNTSLETFIQTMDSNSDASSEEPSRHLSNLKSLPSYKEVLSSEEVENDKSELEILPAIDRKSSSKLIMNGESSSRATTDNEMPPRPLSDSKSLPINVNKEVINSEDGENDKTELEKLQKAHSESSLMRIMKDESSSKATTNDEIPSSTLAKYQSLPAIGENDKSKLDKLQTSMDNQSSSLTQTANHPLSNLQSLRIIGNKEISSEDDKHHKIKWEKLESLKILRFDYLPTLVKLPEGLQQVTTLEEIHIWRCDIHALPDWIGKLESLKTLRLLTCPFLKSLPSSGLGQSLKTLEIVDCPILLQRCQKETGADWKLIQGIKNLRLQQPQSSSIFNSTKEPAEDIKIKQLST